MATHRVRNVNNPPDVRLGIEITHVDCPLEEYDEDGDSKGLMHFRFTFDGDTQFVIGRCKCGVEIHLCRGWVVRNRREMSVAERAGA